MEFCYLHPYFKWKNYIYTRVSLSVQRGGLVIRTFPPSLVISIIFYFCTDKETRARGLFIGTKKCPEPGPLYRYKCTDKEALYVYTFTYMPMVVTNDFNKLFTYFRFKISVQKLTADFQAQPQTLTT